MVLLELTGQKGGYTMNSIKFNDWQEMALKKDTETIIKKLDTQGPVVYSLCWEIVIAVGAIIVDHFFDTESVDTRVWILCVVLAVLPPLGIIIFKLTNWVILVQRVRLGNYGTKRFVDIFDNQICYWVMMCNSYSRILASVPSENREERVFLYQEGCYYNNKSIQALNKMAPVMDKVFSPDSGKVIENNLVAVYRLLSIIKMMKQYQMDLDCNVEDIKSDRSIKEQMEINTVLQKQFERFVDDMNQVFNTSFA